MVIGGMTGWFLSKYAANIRNLFFLSQVFAFLKEGGQYQVPHLTLQLGQGMLVKTEISPTGTQNYNQISIDFT